MNLKNQRQRSRIPFLQFLHLQTTPKLMKKQTNSKIDSNSKKDRAQWTYPEKLAILNFIITYRHKMQDKRVSYKTIEELAAYIDSDKVEKQIKYFLYGLKKKYKSYEDLVDGLAQELKVGSDWILQRKRRSNFIQANKLPHLFSSLAHTISIEKQALNKLFSTLNPSQIEIHTQNSSLTITDEKTDKKPWLQLQREQSKDYPTVHLKILNVSDNQLQETFDQDQINMNEQNKDQIDVSSNHQKEKIQLHTVNKNQRYYVPWGDKQRLRFLVFIMKYKEYFKRPELRDKVRCYPKMSKFIVNKSEKQCGQFYSRYKMSDCMQQKIQGLLQDVYVTEDEITQQVQRVQQFYAQDCQNQLNALTKKKSILLQPSFHQLQYLTQYLNKEILRNQIKTCAISDPIFIEKTQNQQIIQEQKYYKQKQQTEEVEKWFYVEIPTKIRIVIKNQDHLKSINHDHGKMKVDYKNSIKQWLGSQMLKLLWTNEQKKEIQSQTIEKQTKKYSNIQQDQINGRNLQVDEDQSDNQKKEINQKQFEKRKLNRLVYWTISQKIKFAIYLLINRSYFLLPKDQIRKLKLMTRLSEFINTSKTPQNCQDHFRITKHFYKGDVHKMIEGEANRFGITSELLDSRKIICKGSKKYQTKFGCLPLELQISPIQQIVTKDQSMDLKTAVENILRSEIPFQIQLILSTENEKINPISEINNEKIIQQNTQRKFSQNDLEKKEYTDELMEIQINVGAPFQLFQYAFNNSQSQQGKVTHSNSCIKQKLIELIIGFPVYLKMK